MLLLTFLFLLPTVFCHRIAIIGEGVVGLSTALALKELDPSVELHIFHDRPFDSTVSKHIAGLFRIDDIKYRVYGNETFNHLAKLWKKFGGEAGIQLVSGHILSYDKNNLIKQKENYGDIVYNFRFLDKREIFSQFLLTENDNSSAIHYTAFTSEGSKYCPWIKEQLLTMGVNFHRRKIFGMDELADEEFDVVVNCAGIDGGNVAGDDDSVYPVRGILLKVDAPWQKHFLYRDFETISIPVINGVYVGTVKQKNNYDTSATNDEIWEIWRRYTTLQPAMDNVKILSYYVGHRPGRDTIRVEGKWRISRQGRKYLAVHNYGHGGNGFTLAWGTGVHSAYLALKRDASRFSMEKIAEGFRT